MRLLIVEDDTLFGSAAQRALQRAGYAVDWIQSASELSAAMKSFEYGCVLLDLGLGDARGEDCLTAVRNRHPNLPMVVITARGAVLDRVKMLELGADDYMVKPVDLDEVCARVRAVTRRAQLAQSGELAHGDLRLHPARSTATWQGRVVSLTNREFWVLEALVRKNGQVVSRGDIEEALYGWGEEIESNAIEVYIHHLRRKLDPKLIRTVRGTGYRLAEMPPEAGSGVDETQAAGQ